MKAVAKIVADNAKEIGDAFSTAASDIAYDVKNLFQSGLGVPKLIAKAASIPMVVCLAAGTSSLTLDFMSKFFDKRECYICNGWEALRCRRCGGRGKVQYFIKNAGLERDEKPSVESLARAVKEGRADLALIPVSFDMGLPLPIKTCPTCNGTGVMKCTECSQFSRKLVISADELIDAPTKPINIYKKLEVPEEYMKELDDPNMAAFLLIAQPELRGGFQYDDDVRQQILWDYKDWKSYNLTREAIADREPGWEVLQEVLASSNPVGALQDPVIVKNIPYYKAKKTIEEEVNQLSVPPRPSDWGGKIEARLEESDWTEDELKDPRRRHERDVLLGAQKRYIDGALDSAWEEHWRRQKVEEMMKQKIEQFVLSKESEVKAAEGKGSKPSFQETEQTAKSEVPTVAKDAPITKAKVPPEKSKKQVEDERKKKERQARAEKMARQAAEREAALSRTRRN